MEWKSYIQLMILYGSIAASLTNAQVFSFTQQLYTAPASALSITATVQRTGVLTNTVTIGIITDGVITLSLNQLEFLPNVGTFNVEITWPANSIVGDVTSVLTLFNPTEGSLGDFPTTTIMIEGNGPGDGGGSVLPEFYFGQESYTVDENAGPLTIMVHRTAAVNQVTVNININGNLILQSNTLLFDAGVGAAHIVISIQDDNIYVGDLEAVLTLSNPSEGTIRSPGSTIVIVRDDEQEPPPPVPQPPVWSNWGQWGSCNCGVGTRTRTRSCSDGSQNCVGSNTDTESCGTGTTCEPVWSSWGQWGSCNCGVGTTVGTRTRTRSCSVASSDGSPNCAGSSSDSESCICLVWNNWGPWGSCDQTCGVGTWTRTRSCSDGSQNCVGSNTDAVQCNTGQTCPEWNAWGQYGECSASCGGGMQVRTRTCNDFGSGGSCQGSNTNEGQCNTDPCPKLCRSDTESTGYGDITAPDGKAEGYIFVSEQLCPSHTQKENSPIARATCRVNRSGGTYWDWESDCGGDKPITDQLNDLLDQTITMDNVEDTLQTVETLTDPDQPMEIEAEDVSKVTSIIENVVALQTPDRKVTDMVVDIVDNLLDVDVETLMEAQMMDGSSSRIVESFEGQLQIVQIMREDLQVPWPYRRVTPNVASEVFMASQNDIGEGIFASSDSRSTNTLLTLSRDELGTADVEIQIPPEVSEQYPNGARVAFDVLKNNKLLTSVRLANENRNLEGVKRGTNSRVISATVGDQQVSGLQTPVRLTFKPLKTRANNYTECVFWDFNRNDWITDGCTYLGETAKNNTICECNHLTNFAVLMDIYGGSTITPTQDFILEILTYVGCCLSILGLLATLITYCSSSKLMSKRPNQILMRLSATLLGLYIVFIIAISIDTGRDQTEVDVVGCSILAGVLQYFTLASLFWMAVEGYNMYLMFVKVINSYVPSLILKTSLFAWGIPLIIVGITAGVSRENYARTDFCFLEKWPLVGGVLIPIALIILFNLVVFIIVMFKLSRDSPGSKMQQKRKSLRWRRWRNAVCIMTLMGLTWAIGYLSVIKAASFFSQLIFCLLNAMQGYAIFMMYCVQQADVRNTWRRWCGTIRHEARPSFFSSSRGNSSREEFITSNRRSSTSANNNALVKDN